MRAIRMAWKARIHRWLIGGLLGALVPLGGFFAGAAAPVTASGDEAILRSLHEKVMRAHRESRAEALLEDEAADYLTVSRGEITRPTLAERRERLGAYLGRTEFEEYRDLAEPVVRVSADGTLGWVAVQVRARGVQRTPAGEREPLEFVSAWIELYEKRGDRWLRVGNVSNFRP